MHDQSKTSSLSRLFLTMLVGLFGAGVGCSPDSNGRFEVESLEQHQECLGLMFPFEPVFLASRERTESMGLFFQSRGGSFQFVDVMYFEVFDPATVETGVEYELESIADYESRVVAGVEPGESCPDLTDSLALEGTLRFDAFSRDIDGLMRGEVIGQIISLRSGEVVGAGLTGTFEFTVQVGQPYEEFRN